VRGRFAVGAALIASLLACASSPSRVPSSATPRAVGRSGASHKPHAGEQGSTTGGPVIGEYAVVYDGRGELRVEAELEGAGASFAVESGAEPYVSEFEFAAAGATNAAWTRGGRSDRAFVAPPCATGRCRIRYRYALRAAARRLDDLDVASEEGEVIEAPASTWILAPANPDARVRFRVDTTEGTTFVTGVFRARAALPSERAWEIALGDLWTAPYSAFGPLRVRTIGVDNGKTRLELAMAPGKLVVSDDEIASWASDAARAVVGYFGRFPLREALVIIVPSRGRWVGEGKTLSGGGGAIFMRVGERASVRALRADWVLVHEMIHFAFPSVAREHDWAEEGLATYVEPFARARASMMTSAEAWHGLVDGLPNGLPGPGDRGLDRTPTWGRTYWGGALFYLLADIEIRKRTQNKLGLEHALRGILAAGGSNAQRWPLDDVFAAADKAVGVPVLRELHDAMGTSPHPVDLEKLLRELGVVRGGGTVRFDENAPLAEIRRAITTPN
jgi:hypothetical protein